jgi:hypothetical protein
VSHKLMHLMADLFLQKKSSAVLCCVGGSGWQQQLMCRLQVPEL